jgi:hypothetical protein
VYGSLLARVRYSSSASPSSDSWEGMKLPFLYGAADWPQVSSEIEMQAYSIKTLWIAGGARRIWGRLMTECTSVGVLSVCGVC